MPSVCPAEGMGYLSCSREAIHNLPRQGQHFEFSCPRPRAYRVLV